MPRVAAVCVKSVPVGGRFLRVRDGSLTRDGVPHGADPIDEVALTWALRLRTDGRIDRVVAVTMGPPEAADALRRAIAAGADDVLHVEDASLAGADVRTTARVLAAAVRTTGACLALSGNESLDGSSGAVPAAMATFLGWPLVSVARTVAIDRDVVCCERDQGTGPEVAEARLPVVVSVVAGGIDPVYPKLRDVLASRAADIPSAGLRALGVEGAGAPPGERVVGLIASDGSTKQPRVVPAAEGVDEIERMLRDV